MNTWALAWCSLVSRVFVQTDQFLCWGIGDEAFILSANTDCSLHWMKDEQENNAESWKQVGVQHNAEFLCVCVCVLEWNCAVNSTYECPDKNKSETQSWRCYTDICKVTTSCQHNRIIWHWFWWWKIIQNQNLKNSINPSVCTLCLSPHYGPSPLLSSSQFIFRICTVASALTAQCLLLLVGELRLVQLSCWYPSLL